MTDNSKKKTKHLSYYSSLSKINLIISKLKKKKRKYNKSLFSYMRMQFEFSIYFIGR